MRHKKLSEDEKQFVKQIRAIEEQNFGDQLHATDPSRMKSDAYSWLYRPSHHIATGLLTREDIAYLSQPGKRLLSVGAYPTYFEQFLCELGVPSENIVAADKDAAILTVEGELKTICFDATKTWPEIGTFDRIIFPESLCIAIADRLKRTDHPENTAFPNDAAEATLLGIILKQALQRLCPNGEIRANGPMSHPNVVHAMSQNLCKNGFPHSVDYQRYFLSIQNKKTLPPCGESGGRHLSVQDRQGLNNGTG